MNYITSSPRERNKRWPFLRISRNCTWDDQLFKGWRIAFGECMWDEIQSVLAKNGKLATMQIFDVKEKWGELRVDFTCDNSLFDKIDKIIYKYTVLSRHICITCGKPDVGQTTHGWIEPICEDCYKKSFSRDEGVTEEETCNYYQQEISENKRMADMARWISSLGGKNVEHAMWIKDTADEIRARWRQEHDATR